MAMDLIPNRRNPSDPGSAPATGSVLHALLERSVVYERAGAAIPRDLVRFGLYGAAIITLTGLLALMFPDGPAIRHGHFFLLFGRQAAGLIGVLHPVAAPLIMVGMTLATLDFYLADGPRAAGWRPVIVAQAAAGGAGGVVTGIFAVMVVINIVIWAIIFTAVAVGVGVFIFGALQGDG